MSESTEEEAKTIHRLLDIGKIEDNKLENIETKLNLLNPENILKKGYSLTLVEGKIVKSINSVKKGSIIDTKFSDGIIKSEVL